MRSQRLNREQTIYEIRRLNRNIGKRISNIEKTYRLEVADLLSASQHYRTLHDQYDLSNLKNYSEKDLTSIYRQLRYINNLKSSTLKGAKSIVERGFNVVEMSDIIRQHPDMKKEIYKLIGKIEELTGAMLEKFKYEVFDVVSARMFKGENENQIIEAVTNAFQDAYIGGGGNNKDFTILFTDKLKDLLW